MENPNREKIDLDYLTAMIEELHGEYEEALKSLDSVLDCMLNLKVDVAKARILTDAHVGTEPMRSPHVLLALKEFYRRTRRLDILLALVSGVLSFLLGLGIPRIF